jgi:pyruvate,water dikinase
LDKNTLEVIEKRLGKKTKRIIYSDKGVKEADVAPEDVNAFCVTDEEAKEIARICLKIEKHFGVPQDLEWSITDDLKFPDNIFLLQTRPITTIKQQKSTTDSILDMMMNRFYKA